MNPLLPPEHFVPDAEPRVMPDGRLYIYGSYDISGDVFYCSRRYHCFSTADMLNWQHHGQSFHTNDSHMKPTTRLFAPDCIHKDGLYYLCYCGSENDEGIAISDQPAGPFKDGYPLAGADGDAIDPAILLDDDGSVYYYWGQFNLRGAKLTPDMKAIDTATLNTNLLNEDQHGFHEGPCIRKRGGLYYLVYTDTSRGKATALAYAISKNPLGPFEKKGIIIDNDGCDSQTWNNHGGMIEFNGQWYIFYHRSSQRSKYNRRVCAEKINFNSDGTIDEVEMTTQGPQAPPPATDIMPAWRAAALSGDIYIAPSAGSKFGESLRQATDSSWAVYKYIDFSSEPTAVTLSAASATNGGTVEFRLDSPEGELIASCETSHTGSWENYQSFGCPLQKTPTGTRALYLVFRGADPGRLMDVESFVFTTR